MNAWYLAFLVTHLNWPGFFKNFLAFWSLQQFQMKSTITTRKLKWLSLWQANAEYLQKLYLACSPHVSIDPTIERSLINKVEETPYCSSVSMVWWHGYRDGRGFSKRSPWRHWPKKLFILASWSTGKKLILIEDCWSTSSNLLPNYP